jgi:hypothetical protein
VIAEQPTQVVVVVAVVIYHKLLEPILVVLVVLVLLLYDISQQMPQLLMFMAEQKPRQAHIQFIHLVPAVYFMLLPRQPAFLLTIL